ncbi:glycosyltransferase family 39 protein [Halalkalicoccus jeotgali]|nr:glycosyltransferase family 39 protein [Halalkalicoccus jeotgali]
MSFAAIALELPWTDNSPPLYYLVLDIWTATFGYGESTLRLLSALFGIATIVVIYLLGSELYSRDVGLLSAGLLSVSAFHIWYAQEARMYTLLAFLASLSYLFLLKSMNEEARTEYVVLYVVSTVALGYTHMFGLFVILSQSLFIFSDLVLFEGKTDRKAIVRWVTIQGTVGILLLPYVRVLLVRVLTGRGEVWVSIPPIPYLVTTPLSYFGTSRILQWPPAVYLGLLALIGMLGVVAILPFSRLPGRQVSAESSHIHADERPAQPRAAFLLVLWVMIPIAVPIVITYAITPIFVQRYTIPASIGLFILIARGISRLPRPSARVMAVVLVLSVCLFPLPTMYADDQREQWRESAQYVAGGADGDDLVLLSRGDLEYPFDYYFDSEATVTSASENTLREEQLDQVRDSETVWFVFSHGTRAQEAEMQNAIERTHRPAETRGYNDIRIVKYVAEG